MVPCWREVVPDAIWITTDLRSMDYCSAPAWIKISMDGKGAWRCHVFVERLWQNINYSEVYLRPCASVSEARAGMGRYLTFYRARGPHWSLDGKTSDQAYFNQPISEAVAA